MKCDLCEFFFLFFFKALNRCGTFQATFANCNEPILHMFSINVFWLQITNSYLTGNSRLLTSILAFF